MKHLKIKYCVESLISRVPSMFPVISFKNDDYGSIVNSYDFPHGSYGEIVPNISVSKPFFVDNDIEVPSVYSEASHYEYSYRTLMNNYYKYKHLDRNITPEKNDLIAFINNALGLIKVDKTIYDKEQTLVPDYVYLASLNTMIKIYEDMKGRSCCEENTYYKMGGDKFLNFLKSKLGDLKQTSDYLYSCAKECKFKTSLKFNVMLSSKQKDNGILTVYENSWIGGKTYKEGEIITYDDKNYICKKQQGSGGIYNDETNSFVFDINAWEEYPLSTNVRLHKDNNTENYAGSHLKKSWNFFNNDIYEEKNDYLVDGESDSKLKSFRRFKTFTDEANVQVKPTEDEDWLSLYKTGVYDYNSSVDDNGNILFYGEKYNIGAGNVVNNLYSYGSGIINIERDAENNILTFTYVINAHLKAVYDGSRKDDSGNTYHYFKDFSFDLDGIYGKNHGILYTETYPYAEDSGINKIVDFNAYINSESISYNKYPFIVSGKSIKIFDVDSKKVERDVLISNFTTSVKNDKDCLFNPVFKKDYLSGITYNPIIEKDVKILRGKNAAFERHIKLSEIKTIDDLENYQNGGFFNVKKIN